MSENKKQNGNPFISVIIPVYNDPVGLKDTLHSIVLQEYQGDFEVIVADNGSTDNTLDVVDKYRDDYPELIKVVIEDSLQSSYAARNKGLEVARGSIIAFIDADMSVEKDWLSRISDSLENNNADYLGCGVEIHSDDDSIFALYNKIEGFPVEEYINNRHFAPTCCLIVRKSVFDHLGAFDPNLISSGDYEFGNRVYNAGYKLDYDSKIVMKHPARTTFKQIIKKSFRIGRGFYQLSFYYPELQKNMNRDIAGSWTLFTFKKDDTLWKEMSALKKIGIYLIDLTKK